VGGGLNCILAMQPRTFIYRRVPRRFFFIRYVFRIRSLRNCFSATARAPFPTKHPQHSPPRPLPALALPRGAPGGRARLVSNYLGSKSNYLGSKSNYLGRKSNYLGRKSNYLGRKSNYLGRKSNYLERKSNKNGSCDHRGNRADIQNLCHASNS